MTSSDVIAYYVKNLKISIDAYCINCFKGCTHFILLNYILVIQLNLYLFKKKSTIQILYNKKLFYLFIKYLTKSVQLSQLPPNGNVIGTRLKSKS